MRMIATAALLTSMACAGGSYEPGKRTPSPANSTVRHEESRFAGVGGLSLFSQSWRPAGEPRGVLVIVHGLKDHSTRYAAAAAELAERGIAVYAHDLRGHGDSAGDRVYLDSFADYLGDLDIFLQRVRASEPGKPVFLFGHSMGGAIVTLYALEKKPELRGLLLSAAALSTGVGGFTEGSTKALAALFPRLAVFSLDESVFSRDPATAAAMKADPLIARGNAPARTAAELLRAIDKIGESEEKLLLPFLAMHGTADQITEPEGSKELVRRAGSTDKTLKLYEGLWHDLLHEPERAQVLADIAAWIDSRLQK